jgi:hypothetical protein
MAGRVTQAPTEVVVQPSSTAGRVSQVVVEVIIGGGTITGSFTASAILYKNVVVGITADATVIQPSGRVSQAPIEVVIAPSSAAARLSHVVIEVLVAPFTGGTFTADAVLALTSVAGSFFADGIIQHNSGSLSLAADADLLATLSGSFTADAYVSGSTSSSFTANAYITPSPTLTDLIADAVDIGPLLNNHITAGAANYATYTWTSVEPQELYNDWYQWVGSGGEYGGSAWCWIVIDDPRGADLFVKIQLQSTDDTAFPYVYSGVPNNSSVHINDWGVTWGFWYGSWGPSNQYYQTQLSGHLAAGTYYIGFAGGTLSTPAPLNIEIWTEPPANGTFTANAVKLKTIPKTFTANAVIVNLQFNANAIIKRTQGPTAPVSVVGGTHHNSAASSNSLNIAHPDSVQVGDLMVAFIGHSSAANTWSTPTGWTAMALTVNAVVFRKVAVSADVGGSTTFTTTDTSNLTGVVVAVRNERGVWGNTSIASLARTSTTAWTSPNTTVSGIPGTIRRSTPMALAFATSAVSFSSPETSIDQFQNGSAQTMAVYVEGPIYTWNSATTVTGAAITASPAASGTVFTLSITDWVTNLPAFAVIRAPRSVVLSADAIVRRSSGTLTATFDAEITRGVVANAVIFVPNQTGSLSADASLFSGTSPSGSVTADAIVLANLSGSLGAAAITQRTSSASLSAAAIIQRATVPGLTFAASIGGGRITHDRTLYHRAIFYANEVTLLDQLGIEAGLRQGDLLEDALALLDARITTLEQHTTINFSRSLSANAVFRVASLAATWQADAAIIRHTAASFSADATFSRTSFTANAEITIGTGYITDRIANAVDAPLSTVFEVMSAYFTTTTDEPLLDQMTGWFVPGRGQLTGWLTFTAPSDGWYSVIQPYPLRTRNDTVQTLVLWDATRTTALAMSMQDGGWDQPPWDGSTFRYSLLEWAGLSAYLTAGSYWVELMPGYGEGLTNADLGQIWPNGEGDPFDATAPSVILNGTGWLAVTVEPGCFLTADAHIVHKRFQADAVLRKSILFTFGTAKKFDAVIAARSFRADAVIMPRLRLQAWIQPTFSADAVIA